MQAVNNQPRQIPRQQQPLDVAFKAFLHCAPLIMASCVANAVYDIKGGLAANPPYSHLMLFNGFSSIFKGLTLPLFVVLLNNHLHERGVVENRIGPAEIREALPLNLGLLALWTGIVIAWG